MTNQVELPLVIGRYVLLEELASGGMATVYIGRLVGPAGFSRSVAIKRLHPHLSKDPEFVAMLLDEARLAGRIQHPNVAATLDVVAMNGELFVVMEYLHGETLSRLMRAARARGEAMPPDVVAAILCGALQGLHAAHEVKGERGEPLNLVHRDISPQNILVRQDGTAVVLDFGVAKATGRYHETSDGRVKGKLPYMAPEQIRGGTLSRRTDVYAAGVVLWEALVGSRLFKGNNDGEVLEKLLFGTIEPPSSRADVGPELDAVALKALEKQPEDRFSSAREMALAIEAALRPALASRVADWVADLVGNKLEERASRLAELESGEYRHLLTPTGNDPVDVIKMAAEQASKAEPAGPPAGPPAQAPAPPAPPAPEAPAAAPIVAPVSAAPAAAPGQGRRAAFAGLFVGAVLLGGGLVWVLRPPAEPAAAAPSASAAGIPVASIPAAGIPAASAGPSPSATAALPAPAASSAAAASAAAGAASAKATKTPKKSAVDCSIPFTLVDGKKVYKRECL